MFDVMIALFLKTTQRGTKLKWPQEVVSFLEMRTHSIDLMNQILDTYNVILPKSLEKNLKHKLFS